MGIKTQKLSNVVDQIVEWQAVVTADGSTGLTAVAGRGYFIDTTSGAITVTLPASPKIGDKIAIKDYAGTFATNSVTIGRNGNNIQGAANNSEILTNRASVELVFIDSTKGWLFTNESNVADLGEPLFITATGGTIATSGDFKIHSFTGDGCFVVSDAGNSAGSDSVDYLVVAGGGGGGTDQGGGGGAGGYRESSGAASGCYSVSPLGSGVSALPVSATTYPVTVGAGGTGGNLNTSCVGTNGANSVFSTITSTGGGRGGGYPATPTNLLGNPGGSGGGGGGGSICATGGTGNTPPTSPSQGTNGGTAGVPSTGRGGGGATVAGDPAGSNGGTGATSSITGSAVNRAGGGGGRDAITPLGVPFGGGIFTSAPVTSASNGTTNTGGGAGSGGTGSPSCTGGAGGSGIVIIRYKFQ